MWYAPPPHTGEVLPGEGCDPPILVGSPGCGIWPPHTGGVPLGVECAPHPGALPAAALRAPPQQRALPLSPALARGAWPAGLGVANRAAPPRGPAGGAALGARLAPPSGEAGPGRLEAGTGGLGAGTPLPAAPGSGGASAVPSVPRGRHGGAGELGVRQSRLRADGRRHHARVHGEPPAAVSPEGERGERAGMRSGEGRSGGNPSASVARGNLLLLFVLLPLLSPPAGRWRVWAALGVGEGQRPPQPALPGPLAACPAVGPPSSPPCPEEGVFLRNGGTGGSRGSRSAKPCLWVRGVSVTPLENLPLLPLLRAAPPHLPADRYPAGAAM